MFQNNRCLSLLGSLTMSYLSFIRLPEDDDGVDYFYYRIRFDGVNFPVNGPVMQKKTVKWEPSTEKMCVRDGVLKGDVNMALLLQGCGHYRFDFKTTYK